MSVPVVTWDQYATDWAGLHGGSDLREARPWVRRWMHTGFLVARSANRFHVRAGVVTALGLLASVLVPVLVGRGVGGILLAAVFVAVAVLADTVDGALAVLTGHTTKLGYVYDAVVDRIGEVCWLIALWRLGAAGHVVVTAGALAWLHEYVRSRANAAGMTEVTAVTAGERPTRVFVTIGGLVLAGFAAGFSAHVAAGIAAFATAAWIVFGLIGFVQLLAAVHGALAGQRWPVRRAAGASSASVTGSTSTKQPSEPATTTRPVGTQPAVGGQPFGAHVATGQPTAGQPVAGQPGMPRSAVPQPTAAQAATDPAIAMGPLTAQSVGDSGPAGTMATAAGSGERASSDGRGSDGRGSDGRGWVERAGSNESVGSDDRAGSSWRQRVAILRSTVRVSRGGRPGSSALHRGVAAVKAPVVSEASAASADQHGDSGTPDRSPWQRSDAGGADVSAEKAGPADKGSESDSMSVEFDPDSEDLLDLFTSSRRHPTRSIGPSAADRNAQQVNDLNNTDAGIAAHAVADVDRGVADRGVADRAVVEAHGDSGREAKIARADAPHDEILGSDVDRALSDSPVQSASADLALREPTLDDLLGDAGARVRGAVQHHRRSIKVYTSQHGSEERPGDPASDPAVAHEGSANDGSANDGSANDGTGNDGSANDGTGNDGTGDDGAANDGAGDGRRTRPNGTVNRGGS